MIACQDVDLDDATVYMVFYATTMQYPPLPISLRGLARSHRFIATVVALSIEQVFNHMQGEIWSPNGEARSIIEGSGVTHTSMSTGDIIYSAESNTWYLCEDMGWSIL